MCYKHTNYEPGIPWGYRVALLLVILGLSIFISNAYADNYGIVVNGDTVNMPRATFNNLVSSLNVQAKQLKEANDKADGIETAYNKVKDCVMLQAKNGMATTPCFNVDKIDGNSYFNRKNITAD